MDAAELWFYEMADKPQGPVDRATLELLARSNAISRQTLVWTEGMPEWKPAATIRGLFPNPPPLEAGPASAPGPQAAPTTEQPPALPAAPAVVAAPTAAQTTPAPSAPAKKPVSVSGAKKPAVTTASTRKPEPGARRAASAQPAPAPFLKQLQSPMGLAICAGIAAVTLTAIFAFGPSNRGVVAGSGQNGAAQAQPPAEKPKPKASPEALRARALAEYDAFSKDDPHRLEFAERHRRLDQLAKLSDDELWQSTVLQRTRLLQETEETQAGAVAEKIGQSALSKVDITADFKGALETLKTFPRELDSTGAGARMLFYQRKVADKALEKFKDFDQSAQKLMEAGKFDEALAVYAPLGGCGFADVDKLLAVRQAEILDASKVGLNPSQGKSAELSDRQAFYAADVYAAMPGITEAFDAALKEAISGVSATALEKCDVQHYPRSALFYYIQALSYSRDGLYTEAKWRLEQARRLALPNDAFRSRMMCADVRLEMINAPTVQSLSDMVDKCQDALALYPKNADAWFVRGFCELAYSFISATGSNEAHEASAREAFNRAAQIDPAYSRFATDLDKYGYTGAGGNAALVSVVRVMGHNADHGELGTGFIVECRGKTAYVITNHHVIQEMKEMSVLYQMEQVGAVVRRETTLVKILADDTDNDLALLQIEAERPLKRLPFRQTMNGLTVPMKLTVIGHPRGLDFTVVSGELSNLNRMANGHRHLQINANVEPGMSGGPVIDENGFVIGVTVAKYQEIAGQGLAILSEHVRDICAQAGVTISLGDGSPTRVAASVHPSEPAIGAAPKDDGIQRGLFNLVFKDRSPLSAMGEQAKRLHLPNTPEDCDISKESFAVSVPDDYSKEQASGLLVWLDALPEPRLPDEFRAALNKANIIWIAPRDCGDNRKVPAQRLALAIDAVHNIKSRYQIDSRRVYAAGCVYGAEAATRLALCYPDVFSGGGLFILDCDRYKDVQSGAQVGQGWPRQFTADASMLPSAKRNGRFVLMTGQNASNREIMKNTYDHLFLTDGFAFARYLEVPGMGDELPAGTWFERAMKLLDEPLMKPITDLLRDAENSEKNDNLSGALETYSKVVEIGGAAPEARAQAAAKVAEISALKKKQMESIDQAIREKRYSDAIAAINETIKKFEAQKPGEAHALLAKAQREQKARSALDDAQKLAGKDLVKGYQRLRNIMADEQYKGSLAASEAQEQANAIMADKAKAAKIEAADTAKRADDKLQIAWNLKNNGDLDATRETLQQILKDFPNTPAATEAKTLLEKLSK